jgi:hypothetical protein
MSTVKAKFTCGSIVDLGHYISASFYAVYSNTGENVDYSKATPNGNLNITIDKETKAAEFFERGKTYYLTFEEAPTT